METTQEHGLENAAGVVGPVTVTVNERPVQFQRRRVTGTQIKAAAINQGVPVQLDFALFEVKGNGNLKQVGDDEIVALHPHQKFRAVAPDDNSQEGGHDPGSGGSRRGTSADISRTPA